MTIKVEDPEEFWLSKTLDEMTDQEWERLCDGCGLCCLNKLIDDETHEVYYTNVACDEFDRKTCTCKHYDNRFDYQSDCIKLTKENVSQISWLPKSCAYYRILHQQPLPKWHPLITGTKNTKPPSLLALHQRTVHEKDVICWEDHIMPYPTLEQ